MSVRRLADDAIQPAEFAFSADNQSWAEKRMALYPTGRQQSAVIPLLMRVQDQEGWISRAAIEKIAAMLGMAYIRVLEVATFYTQFQLKPVGTRAHIQVCGTTPCMLRGAEHLRSVCQNKINHEPHELNDDGTLSWEEVECLGACVNAPMIAIGHDTYEDLTPERLGEIIDAFGAGQGDTIKPGTQIDRLNAAAIGGRTTLLEEPTAHREKFVPPPAPEPAPGAAPAAAPAAAAPTAPAAPAPAAATLPQEAKPAAPQAPTDAARPRSVNETSAPAFKGPSPDAKVSEAEAEKERAQAAVEAKADGTPNDAMREGATGAESPAGKIDGGAAPGKDEPEAPANGAQPATTRTRRSKPASTPETHPEGKVDIETAKPKRTPRKKPEGEV